MTPLTPRERLIGTVKRQPLDRGFVWQDSPWPETRQRWLSEGMPPDASLGRDGQYAWDAAPVNIGYCPAWQTGPVKDEGDTHLVRDEYGIVKRVWKNKSGMPQFVSFPVANRQNWEDVKPRLAADEPGRFPSDWPARAGKAKQSARPIAFGGTHLCGFFSFLREICGDEVYYLFYDEPSLAHEMLEFQADRLSRLVRRAATDTRIDAVFVWEDMCYKTGPLVGPALFRQFILPPLKRYLDVVRSCGIPIIDLDSDGNVESLIPLWIEAGVNMIHPMEVAAGMDVVRTSGEYGRDVALRGGVDKRELTRDRNSIDRELERVRVAWDRGGYIPHVDHTVPPDVSWENFRYYLDRREAMLCGQEG
jgi:hypothetical protein